MNANDMEVANAMGGFVMTLLVVFGIVLAVCAVLMPLYVVAIHGSLRRQEKMMKELVWYAKERHRRGEDG